MTLPATIVDGVLRLDGTPVLSGLPEAVSLRDDPLGQGAFLRLASEAPLARHRVVLGGLPGLRRFTCCFRSDPWWVTPAAGTEAREVPVETQFLLVELPDDRCLALLPVLDGPFHATLEGTEGDEIAVVVESGDSAVRAAEVTGLFLAVGDNPYALMAAAAESITAQMGTGRLRREKALPDFADLFGWCTWDAFYAAVSQDNVRKGLESFAEGGVLPRFLLLDDGWQSHTKRPTGELRTTACTAIPERFPEDLGGVVRLAKGEYGLDIVLVWHTLQGYWAGVEAHALREYRSHESGLSFAPGLLHHKPNANEAFFGHAVNLIDTEDIYRFFQDFHRHLREQGVDGVKVDNQGTLDGLGAGRGGMVELMRAYHAALEGSVQLHFQGRVINCMSVSTNMVYHTLNSTVTRSSTDFWPKDPASHGRHMYTNAQASLWLGEFVHPDWDMFQSGHAMGAFHAAGRAVSGGPVYVSDTPDGHDFEVLRKLVCSDGTVLRAHGIGRPTHDCLFVDPTREEVLLKIFNLNLRAGLVGVFNARYHAQEAEGKVLHGTVSPADVDGLEGERFAVYAHNQGTLAQCNREDRLEIALAEGAFELFTIVPVEEGLAPVGLPEKMNSAGAITAKGPDPRGGCFVAVRDGGQFLAWCERRPPAVWVDDAEADFTFDDATGALRVAVAEGPHVVRVGQD